MNDFNQFFTIFQRDTDGMIKSVTRDDGSLLLCVSFTKANEILNNLQKENPMNFYMVHSIEVAREMFI